MAIELFFMICLGILIYKSIKCILHSLRISNCLDRHVLITGCDSGFGHLLVKRLEKLGFHVFACCLTERALEEFRLHNTSKVIPLHQVTNDKSVHACLEKVRRNLGDVGLWAVVNNAGIAVGTVPIEILPLELVQRCVDVNLFGMIRVTKAFLPLVRQSRGRIVNMSSVMGRHAFGSMPYTIAKYGVEAFSDKLRRELYCTGVTVHILEPGGYKTNILTPEVVRTEVTKIYEQADKEVQEFYGQQYIEKFIQKMSTAVERRSTELWRIVDCYEHAITARYPLYRYIVGVDSYLTVTVLANLPEWLQDYLYFRSNPLTPAKC